MKQNAHPIETDKAGAPGQGAAIVTRASFPVKPGSVTAEVLARLLRGERLTSLETVNAASTTRLAAVIEYLATRYGWGIAREDLAAGCRDGRVAWVREYRLSSETIAQGMKAGAAAWCADVWAARGRLRQKAPEARAAAVRANRARRPGHRQGLGGLLESEGAGA